MTDQETAPAPEPATPAEWLAQVRRSEGEGELFLAYDVARQGLQHFPDDIPLKHRAVLCLASSGATRRALEEFAVLGLERIARDGAAGLSPRMSLDIASLGARLLKDTALAASGPERRQKLRDAAAAYDAIFRRAKEAGNPESYYPGINVATLLLLAGDTQTAQDVAREIQTDLAAWPADRKSYYEIATELEAAVILNQIEAAQDIAATLCAVFLGHSDPDYRSLASTIQQLRLVTGVTGSSFDLTSVLSPPAVVHYLGHIISAPGNHGRFAADQEGAVRAAIDEAIAAIKPRFAYGSLAAGADILFAEAMLEQGASLHVVLPFCTEDFIEASVRPAGANWVERFHRCLGKAEIVRFATEDRYLGDDELFNYCSQLGMGMALLRARHLSGKAEQIAVWDSKPAGGTAGTAVDVATWKATGMPQTIIPLGERVEVAAPTSRPLRDTERRTRAMLFGDVKGFSKLTDEQLPPFVDAVLGSFARVLERFSADLALANTWGDGLFLVLEDAGKAASCALALQEAMSEVDLAEAGLPETMALRLGGHFGPVYSALDPILQRQNYFGAHVSRAARIEPITPEKLVYVTETLAAVLALHNADEFTCQYVGMTKAAKDYGHMRMFLLGRRARPDS